MFRKLNAILAFSILLQILIQNIEGKQQQEKRTLEENLNAYSDQVNRTKRWARFFDGKYSHGEKGYTKKYITYKISKYTKQLRKKAVDRIIKKAFKLWQEPTKWKFKQRTSGYIDIDIKFLRGYFGSYPPIAGQASIFPSIGDGKGTIIFNDDHVRWRDTEDIMQIPSSKTLTASLAWVAAHEIGHVLGLGHSKVKGSVMIEGHKMPKYPGRKFSLHRDDKQGIRAIMKGTKTKQIVFSCG